MGIDKAIENDQMHKVKQQVELEVMEEIMDHRAISSDLYHA